MSSNVISEILPHARSDPDRIALAVYDNARDLSAVSTVTFGELCERAQRIAGGLARAGIARGDRVILASPPSIDFYALALGVLGHGAAVVLIDGAMDRRRLLNAMRASRAAAIVSVDEVLRRWPLIPSIYRMRRYSVGGARFGVRHTGELEGEASEFSDVDLDDPAIVSFTSGTTGRAKGANRTHRILRAQHHALARQLPFEPDDVDMPCFPAVVLHNMGCGVTTVLPPVDLRLPRSVEPDRVVPVIRRFDVTTLSGAPAYLTRLASHIVDAREDMSPVRRVVAGGAPVTRPLCELLLEAFPRADVVVVYGSTEAEPIAHVSARDVRDDDGEGLLVGAPVPDVRLELLSLPDRIERPWTPDEIAAARTRRGEVVVSGDHVNEAYFGDSGVNALNKIREPGGRVWHRTRDIARLDASGGLWLLGRVGDAVERDGALVHPLPVESAVTELSGVRAAALVAHAGAPSGELAVAGEPSVVDAVRVRLAEHGLEGLPVTLVDSIPMDGRHNSKVDRAALRRALEAR